MASTAPVSLSVYRGQSRQGIGEGPGRLITQGEQYLQASPELARDADLLDAIRLWMSLDSDPADHQKLDDCLEAWSFFISGKWQLVARLVSFGIFDRRAAYFAHGRLWPSEVPGFDPGLHIGRSEIFESPWRDGGPGERVPEPGPPLLHQDRIKAEPEVAALFLAHLLQSTSRRRPLVVLAPLAEFAAGSSLPSLLAFARGALPANLRQECRVRIYTRTPELFLRHPGAALVAMPEDLQERVRSVRREARLIDRQGRLVAGEPLEGVVEKYARAVLEGALRIPEGLTRFGERFQARSSRTTGEIPGEREVRAVQVTYNLAVALGGSMNDREHLIRTYLPWIAQKLGPSIDWQKLVTAEEWQAFPPEPLLGLLFMNTQELPGVRELQKAVEQSGALGRAVEQGLLDPSRVCQFLETAPEDRLAAVAQELLRIRGLFGGAWGNVPVLLLERLRGLKPVPRELASPLVQASREVDPSTALPFYLRLADLVARIEEAAGPQDGNDLPARLWHALPRITDPGDRELLVEAALSPQWRCLQPRSLVYADTLRAPWLETMAHRLVEHQDLLQALGVAALLQLAGRLETRGDLERVFDAVDIHMTRDLRSTTDALTRAGWWTAWRRTSRLLVGEPQWRPPVAEAWLTSPAWTEERAREAVKEDWDWVMGHLPAHLTGAARPWSEGDKPRRLWPWIPPFEEDQLTDLAERMPEDLVSCAELAEAASAGIPALDFGVPVHRFVFRRSPLARRFQHEDALGWIVDRGVRGELPPLDLADSLRLWQMAGARKPRAQAARLASILHCLKEDRQAEEAIDGASQPNLWATPGFLGGLAAWMNERGTVGRIGVALAEKIDRQIDGEPDRPPKPLKKNLVKELLKRGLKRAAGLLDARSAEIEEENLTESVVEALVYRGENETCWGELAGKIGAAGSRHPLSLVAERVREEQGERRINLVRSGWTTFETVAREHPKLMDFSPDHAGLPLFDLAASLSQPGGLGNAAAGVIYLAQQGQRSRREWWEALLRELLAWRRYPALLCAEDRSEAAMALIVRLLDGLPAEERKVFWDVYERGARQISEQDHSAGAQ